MKKLFLGIAVVLAFGMMAVSAMAGEGNNMPPGPHYNLNIIGVDPANYDEDGKDVGDSNGHTMFVDIGGTTEIEMTQFPGSSFEVVDRNGLDDGHTEFNLEDTSNTETNKTRYLVFVRALGKPGLDTYVTITPHADFTDAVGGHWFYMGAKTIRRSRGKPVTVEVTGMFYVNVDYVDPDVKDLVKEWIFNVPELEKYWWDYANHGCKLLQVRFYEDVPPYWEPPAGAPPKGGPTTTWAAIKSR